MKTMFWLDFDEPIKEYVLYVLGIRKNIFSMGHLVDWNLWILFNKKNVFVLNNELLIIGHGVRDFSIGLYISQMILHVQTLLIYLQPQTRWI